ncbi:MAG: phosphate acetyltransferase [Phycisphaerae bacterium]|nr:phosphate acetyltransferase [Phycisphaerae bacterium]
MSDNNYKNVTFFNRKDAKMTQKDKFLETILTKASQTIQHIVLPEGDDTRTLDAAVTISQKKIAKLTILGNTEQISASLAEKNADMSMINVIDPATSAKLSDYANMYFELRKNKGVTQEDAIKQVADMMYYGVMMVKSGDADGMVAGAAHSSSDTIRPALQIVKSTPGIKTISSVFFMSRGEELYLFADCALNIDPDAEQIGDITVSTAKTAKQFGLTPKVAMLSYSTRGSGGEKAGLMVQATKIAKEKMAAEFKGEYAIDGELQFDAAVVPAIAESKAPGSDVKGQANVFIFPDIDAGNIAYKITQRLGSFNAYGPTLQGIAKPINDLSRGCSADDIVATVAITSIQASQD